MLERWTLRVLIKAIMNGAAQDCVIYPPLPAQLSFKDGAAAMLLNTGSAADARERSGAALALHRAYPENRDSLAGKQGGPVPYKTPVEFPALATRYGREVSPKHKGERWEIVRLALRLRQTRERIRRSQARHCHRVLDEAVERLTFDFSGRSGGGWLEQT